MRPCVLVSTLCLLASFGYPENRDADWQAPSAGQFTGLDHGEFLIDTGTVFGPRPWDQSNGAVASDGANFLAVWVDEASSPALCCTRLTPGGAVLDPSGLEVRPKSLDKRPVLC